MSRLPESAKYGWLARVVFWMMKRSLGRVTTPARWVGLHPRVLLPWTIMMAAQQGTRLVAPGLKSLARIETARLVGCPF
jgi:hypothetical protein